MTVTNIKAFIGSPGTGKSYRLVRMVNQLLKQGESVHIMNPTRSARNNLRKAFKEMLVSGEMTQEDYKQTYIINNVQHGYKESLAKNIFIDESAMIDLDVFYSLLYATLDVPDVHLYLFGDLKQIEPVNGDSILKTLIESNMGQLDERNIWQFTNEVLYKDLSDMTIATPKVWKLNGVNVDVTILKKNYRLESKNFSGYDDEYYSSLIDNAIFTDDYSGYLKYALEHNWLITTPTNARGDEIDNMLSHKYDDFKKVAPFVVDGNSDYYLNPFNQSFNQLKESFDFMPQIELETTQGYEFTAYMSTHRVQSFTVDNVLFYMGNNPIGNRHKSHFSNNMLYTAVTRAKHDVQLLGLPDSFTQMRNTMPQTAQEKNVHLRANVSMNHLYSWIESNNNLPSADELFKHYQELYEDDSILSTHDKTILDIYSIVSDSYSKRYVINSVNNKYGDKFGFTLTAWLKENSANAKKSPRKGKVKQWIDSLSDDELEVVKQDINDLSVRKFKEKYEYTKSTVKKLV
ncbi:PIF1 family ATP-dependent DNA helicase [Leuconostoc pseudomesenteroides]|uniref:PIF1 family ATP-dependent DNA helicase n=1 Tax=Leuconostoc pseudomesenteroides TaxID=33968 RepID=UPI0021A2FDA8|nr:PIF1 family ATP-dependent DNA helicase [Leuconostoc pseudomesenteroides]MCT4380616.1 hypothetical protein [Leuconostoc pseudomesenteroides]